MAPCYGWGSTVSRLQSHYEETVYFEGHHIKGFLTPVSFIILTTFILLTIKTYNNSENNNSNNSVYASLPHRHMSECLSKDISLST